MSPVVLLETEEWICTLMSAACSFPELAKDFKHDASTLTLQPSLLCLFYSDVSQFDPAFVASPHFLDEQSCCEPLCHLVQKILDLDIAGLSHNVQIVDNLTLLENDLGIVLLRGNLYFDRLAFALEIKGVLLR